MQAWKFFRPLLTGGVRRPPNMTKKIPKKNPRQGIEEYGRNKLHYAADAGDVETVDSLLNQGLDINAQDDNGWTALHFAAQMNHANVIELLLSKMADPNLVDIHGNNPLWTATMKARGDFRCVELLLMAGSNPSTKNKYGRSPIEIAKTIANGLETPFEKYGDNKA